MPLWDADLEISPDLAARLISEQFPELEPVRVEPFGIGWDNVAYRVNGAFIFRFPRRAIAVRLLEIETHLLPILAPILPLPVPNPQFIGAPTVVFSRPFTGYSLLPGRTACSIPLTDFDRHLCSAPLARFLAVLHAVPVAEMGSIPGDELLRADMGKRLPGIIERLQNPIIVQTGIDTGRLIDMATRLAAQTRLWNSGGCVVHGDLYARHLLLNDDRSLCGIIDWGDVHLGDPALDLSIAFSFLPPGDARNAFRLAYGSIDAATWDRARFRAISYGAILTLYGADTGDLAIRAAGEYALRAAAE